MIAVERRVLLARLWPVLEWLAERKGQGYVTALDLR